MPSVFSTIKFIEADVIRVQPVPFAFWRAEMNSIKPADSELRSSGFLLTAGDLGALNALLNLHPSLSGTHVRFTQTELM